MRKTKILFIIWAILVIVIVGLLTTMDLFWKIKNEKYHELEEKIVESATKYITDQVILEENEKIILDVLQLIEDGYLDSLDVENDTCSGYVIIENKGTYEYSPFITCSHYTTLDYDKNK